MTSSASTPQRSAPFIIYHNPLPPNSIATYFGGSAQIMLPLQTTNISLQPSLVNTTEKSKLYVGGLSADTTEDELINYFSRWGQVADCIVVRNKFTNVSRRFAFITFANPQTASYVLIRQPHFINQRLVHLNRPYRTYRLPLIHHCNGRPSFLERDCRPDCELHLSGLDPTYHTLNSLKEYFERFGTIRQVEILANDLRRSAFVIFEERSSLQRCLSSCGTVQIINGARCLLSVSISEVDANQNEIETTNAHRLNNKSVDDEAAVTEKCSICNDNLKSSVDVDKQLNKKESHNAESLLDELIEKQSVEA